MTFSQSSEIRRGVLRTVIGLVATVAIGFLATRYGVYGDWGDFEFRQYHIDPVLLDRGVAFAVGLILTVTFPEIWALVPLLAASLDMVLFIREIATRDVTMWPFGLMDRLMWIFCGYVGAGIGIVYVRSRRVP